MWTRLCASPRKPVQRSPKPGLVLPVSFKSAIFLLLLCFCLVCPSIVRAAETIVSAVTLNQQPKGDFFVILLDDGDFLVRSSDLGAMGLVRIPGSTTIVDGESYVALRSAEGLKFYFDEKSLTLQISAAPALFGTTSLDLSPTDRKGVYYPRDNSFFLNYGVEYVTSGDNFQDDSYNLTNELGIRLNDVLLLSDSSYSKDDFDSNFVRLNTRLIHDDRETLQRYVAGDFFASSGTLGSQVNLGGLSLSKVYDINPYLIYYPMFGFNGQLALPSEVDIYLGGTKLRSERFAPGEFSIENLYGFYGEETVEVVIRDAFGRERRIRQPFYFTDLLLRKGLHEYSYNLGWIRDDFGQKSNSYSDLAASAFHRYGLTDSLNLGVRGEGKQNLVNLGVESIFNVGHYGILRLESSISRYRGSGGAAGLVKYDYQSRRFHMQLGLQSFSKDYRTLRDSSTDDPKIGKLAIQAGIGYATPLWGSLNLDYARTDYYNQQDREVISATWSKRIWKRTYLNTTVRRVWDEQTSDEAFVNFTYYFNQDYSLATSYRHTRGEDVVAVDIRKVLPVGEGTGWELHAEHDNSKNSDTDLLSADIEQNARYAKLRGTFSQTRRDSSTDETVRVAASGAIVHLGWTTALTRPVTDSFALVQVGELEDVQVNVNGQAISRTNSEGKVIIPEVSSYYENQLSFNDKDVPIEYIMPQVRLTFSPPLRSGSCLFFPLEKYQAFTGTLLVEAKDGNIPLADAKLQFNAAGAEVSFWTGRDGEFYLDTQQSEIDVMAYQGCGLNEESAATSIRSGTYIVNVRQEALEFQAQLVIPASTDTYVDMGRVTLEPLPGSVGQVPPPSNEKPVTEEKIDIRASGQPSGAQRGEPEATDTTNRVVDESLRQFTVRFHFDSVTLLEEDLRNLAGALEYLKNHLKTTVEIEGFTSKEGNARYNFSLGLNRAHFIKNYLVKSGVSTERITKVQSYGEEKPVCEGNDKPCLQQNRRAVMIVIKSPGK